MTEKTTGTEQIGTEQAGSEQDRTEHAETKRTSSGTRPSSTPVGRSLGFERSLLVVLGLVLLAAGALALIVGSGLLGTFRAQRPVLDPVATQWLGAYPQVAIPIAAVLGVLLLLLGLWWVARALRPEPRPDLRLESGSDGGLTVTGSALTSAIRTDAERLTGVTRARVRMAGDTRRPNLRITLSLQEGTDVRQVWEELDDTVLSRSRQAMETDELPTAVRLELDRAARQRVR